MPNPECRHVQVTGRVQGVGFRPFVCRLARRLGLQGEVYNGSSCVRITVQGPARKLEQFLAELRRDAPGEPLDFRTEVAAATSHDAFEISGSRADTGMASVLLTDQALCEDCVREFNDPTNRRYRFPFISCPRCGPRFSVCERLPWDRENTSWRHFPLCDQCRKEHADPEQRRFHAVGLSCPQCGPALSTGDGRYGELALIESSAVLARGGVLAVKGTTGFHLMVDATNSEAVDRLRTRKRRRKPLAVLAPDLQWVTQHAAVDDAETRALRGAAAPIVLLQAADSLAERLAPGLGMLGVMLPSSGIQLALMQKLQRPLVATSANVSGSPLIYRNHEALARLSGVADAFLLHDLELVQGLDDSVVRVMAGRSVSLRLGRGLAPQTEAVPEAGHSLGCGAHVKGSLALQDDRILVIGPHIGDLDGAGNRQRYRQQKRSLPAFFQAKRSVEVTDLHPDYGSTLEADYRAASVPHHIAHAMATWLEHQPEPPFQVLTWDGVGLGPDGTIWGGECLQFDPGLQWRRRASLYRFHLASGAAVARYPGRVARALTGERPVGNSVVCSSMGRLIEGMAALAGLREENLYEAQIAMEWEALGHAAEEGASMDFAMDGLDLDWRPLLPVITDQRISIAARSLGFHRALARAAVRQCMQGRGRQVLLSGGVFQNRLLVELLMAEAHDSGLQILLPERLPPNDGGIAAGQCVALAMAVRQEGVSQACV